jgi:hypothetical protein
VLESFRLDWLARAIGLQDPQRVYTRERDAPADGQQAMRGQIEACVGRDEQLEVLAVGQGMFEWRDSILYG